MGLPKQISCGLTMMMLASHMAFADVYSASEAYKAKDYQKAFAEFKELAELVHPASQFVVGLMYFNGEGVSRNRLVGYGWTRLAADAGNEAAKKAEPKMREEIDEENVERARSLLKRFWPDSLAASIYPKVLDNCDYEDRDFIPPKIMPKTIGSIDQYYPVEMRYKGMEGSLSLDLMIDADGFVRDSRIAYSYPNTVFDKTVPQMVSRWQFTPAMRLGKPVPISTSIMVNFSLKSSSKNYSAAEKKVATIKQEAEQGDVAQQYVYGLLLSGHPHFRKPLSDALPWFIKSAQGGMALAQYRVGKSLLSGQGCEKDETKAREWLIKAAQQDLADAQLELARLSLRSGPLAEPDKGMFWLERAVGNGSTKAKKYLSAILATSDIESVRSPQRASDLSDEVLKASPTDIVSLETKAAALAELGQFEQAEEMQKRALKQAKKLGWEASDLQERLAAYQAKQTWHGELLMF